ncbi:tyrosine-type recombinase/integrase [Lysobacter soli]|uniref:tyrosine-type recombinase/integrase n=1 Tax=Lysobacter soli TaxID=453783 RepID=UPI00240FD5AA|nr:tyrosine-type recombinase/integrase [Lysobacter soli]MDG2516390.1 tyrosine-type recombinase/integrase [Lysobacter soli]
MPKAKFTEKGLAALLRKPHPERIDYFDSAFPGLSLRVGPRGATWFYLRRIDGRLTRLSLGRHDDLARAGAGSLPRRAGFTVARERAGEVEGTLAAGKHPRTEAARKRAAERESRAVDELRLVRHLAREWEANHLPTLSERTQRDYKRALGAIVDSFGDEDAGTVRRRDLIRYLDHVKLRSPAEANRHATVLRLLFSFGQDRCDMEANPAASIRNPGKQRIRDRTLDRSEIRVLWRAAELAGYPYGNFIHFALCTGQRVSEIGALRRDDISGDGDIWIQRAHRNKSRKRVDIFLDTRARGALDACPNFGPRSPFFVASTDSRGNPRGIRPDAWNKALVRHIEPNVHAAAAELGLRPISASWTMHDLRRTVRTGLTGWCGINPDTAERVLNHAIGDRLRKTYDHSDYMPHVTAALARWNHELTEILRGKSPVVVPLKKKRRATG